MLPDSSTLRHWNSRDAPVVVQVLKYGLCGGLSTVVQLSIALVLAFTTFPAMDGSIVDGAPITDALRERNLIIANAVAFPFSNLTAYSLNVRWVFTPGRHHPVREFFLFTLISAFSFFSGLLGGPKLIGCFGISSVVAQASFMFTSALVNFVCRKFLIFAR